MKKALKIIGILILLLLIFLVAAPFIFKGKIIEIARSEANKNLNAKVNFDDDIGISIFRSFPDMTVTLDNLLITGINEFDGDTLAFIPNFETTLDIKSVINGEKIDIKSIAIEAPVINAIVTKDGKANWDIAKTDTTAAEPADTAETKFNLSLETLTINDGRIGYFDTSLVTYAYLNGIDFNLKGDFTQDLFNMDINSVIEKLTVNYDGIDYLDNVKTDLKAVLAADMPNFKFTFKENEVKLNQLEMGFDGFVAMPAEDIDMDIKFFTKKTDFKNILSLVPAIYSKDFKDLQATGKASLNGFAKGKMTETALPSFDLKLLVDNAMFKYPALPTPVNDVNINLQISNPGGDADATLINMSKLHFVMAGDPFDAKLMVRNPITDPLIDAAIKGKINLGNVTKIVPLDPDMRLAGILESDIQAKGRLSTIEKGQYEQFEAKGNVIATGINFISKDLPQGFNMSTGRLDFSPRVVTLSNMHATTGKSDFAVNGEFSNFFAYMLSSGVLKGKLDMNSNVLDANQFLAEDGTTTSTKSAPQPDDTIPMEAFLVPENIDFTLSTNINTLYYDNLVLDRTSGVVQIMQKTMILKNISMGVLNGRVNINGSYETTNPLKPGVNMAIDIQNMDIKKWFQYFNTIRLLAPIAKFTEGIANLNFKFNGDLDQHMSPVLPSIFASGLLNVAQANIKGFPAMVKIADAVKMPKYKELNIKGVKIDFKVENGRIDVKPFDVKVGPLKMTTGGSTGFDQTLDYDIAMQVPRSELGMANDALNKALGGLSAKGVNLQMSDMVNIDVDVLGTVMSPVVTTNFKKLANNTADALKDRAKQEFDVRKKELENKAKAEADKVKAEAEAKVRAEQERLRNEAEARKKQEEERLKKEAEKKAKDKLKGIFK